MTRILIVDDEVYIAEFLRDLLDGEGFQTRIARNGHEALEILDAFRADIIISDVMMPYMTGIDLARILRRDPVHCDTPIIFVSAGPRPPRAADISFAAYFSKPFEISALLDAIDALL